MKKWFVCLVFCLRHANLPFPTPLRKVTKLKLIPNERRKSTVQLTRPVIGSKYLKLFIFSRILFCQMQFSCSGNLLFCSSLASTPRQHATKMAMQKQRKKGWMSFCFGLVYVCGPFKTASIAIPEQTDRLLATWSRSQFCLYCWMLELLMSPQTEFQGHSGFTTSRTYGWWWWYNVALVI